MLAIESTEIAGTLTALSIPSLRKFIEPIWAYYFKAPRTPYHSNSPLLSTRPEGLSRFGKFLAYLGWEKTARPPTTTTHVHRTCPGCGHTPRFCPSCGLGFGSIASSAPANRPTMSTTLMDSSNPAETYVPEPRVPSSSGSEDVLTETVLVERKVPCGTCGGPKRVMAPVTLVRDPEKVATLAEEE